MTAQVGVLNRKGVALATDSAVTIGIDGKKKAFNTAEKLFELLKDKPIGIMMYNNADFVGIPWEIIIKDYKEKQKNVSFEKLEDYCDDFFRYLENCSYLKNIDKKNTIAQIVNFHLNEIFKIANKVIENRTQDRTINANEAKDIILESVLTYELMIDKEGIYPDFENLYNNNYLCKYDNELYYLIDSSVSQKVNISQEEKEKILLVLKKSILSNSFSDNYTGIVITGYGEEDIFPSLFEYKVELLLCNMIKKYNNEPIKIDTVDHNEYSRAAIRTFAQAEMAKTYITGINPTILNNISRELDTFIINLPHVYQSMLQYKKEEKLVTSTECDKLELTEEQNEYFKEVVEVVKSSIEDNVHSMIQEDYISPFIGIVDSLDKQQLAELAENLVNLTSFKRKMSIETETVGGPIDVAIISKGEGFIWIKRKYYFDSKFNPSYVDR